MTAPSTPIYRSVTHVIVLMESDETEEDAINRAHDTAVEANKPACVLSTAAKCGVRLPVGTVAINGTFTRAVATSILAALV